MSSSPLPSSRRLARLLGVALAGLLGAAGAAQAASYLVRIEDMGLASNLDLIEVQRPGFGSVAGATLDWDPFPATSRSLRNWVDPISGRAAAYCGNGADCSFDLLAGSGAVVGIDSFWLGGWPETNRRVHWSVVDLATGSVLLADAPAVQHLSGRTGLTVAVGARSTVGLRVQFGPAGFNAGIDDIRFSVSAVPEPSTWALWLLGLGGIALQLRRRRR